MDVLIIVVIYNVMIEEIKFLEQIRDSDILIYDNSHQSQKVDSRYLYYHSGVNVGVSAAYNYGIKLAKEMKKQYVILLDQDSEFGAEHLKTYLTCKEKYGDRKIYAPIVVGNNKVYSPFIEKWNRNLCQVQNEFVYKDIYDLTKRSVINSGLMIPLNVIDKIGDYNEKIKLDFSDIYFMEKYKEYNNSIILINIFLKHSISGDEGKNKTKELNRFRYYCNSVRELNKVSIYAPKYRRMLFFRMLKLMVKYKTLKPIIEVGKYYLGAKTI